MKKEFKLHKAALYSIIVAQAGTFEKALLELVMNAVDADSTFVSIELTNTDFSVTDDGHGFPGEYEIDHYFGTFGTPHMEGDATYGKFRMGRGQVMAFTKNVWRSNDFKMEVDIKNSGDHYIFTKDLPIQAGCQITGSMYEPLIATTRRAIECNLAEMCRFVSIDVTINGELVSKKHLAEKWTFQDDNAYYLLSPQRSRLSIFNLGVLVKETWARDVGMGGIILSKKQLTVNMARNDVLVSQCLVWKAITKAARAYTDKQNVSGKVVKNENWRQAMASKFICGEFTVELPASRLASTEIFTLITGKHVSLNELASLVRMGKFGDQPGLPFFYMSENDQVPGENLHRTKQAVVLSEKTGNRFGTHRALSAVIHGLRLAAESANTGYRDARWWNRLEAAVTDEPDLDSFFVAATETIEDKALSKDARRVLACLQRLQYSIVRTISHQDMYRSNRYTGNSVDKDRQLLAGRSEAMEAWTDGTSRIWINERNLVLRTNNFAHMLGDAVKLITLLVHEYMHDDDDAQTNVHGLEFYENFENAVCFNEYVGRLAGELIKDWMCEEVAMQKKDKARHLRQGEIATMDLMEKTGVDLTAVAGSLH